MTSLAVVINTLEIEAVANRLQQINAETLGRSTLAAVNKASRTVYDESRKRMLSGVNLTDDYVQSRMMLEAANNPNKPEAVIVAFRAGGRRPGTRPVNLRQYAAVQQVATNNWSNSGVATDSGVRIPVSDLSARSKMTLNSRGGAKATWLQNPRKPGSKLPWIPRVGAPALGIPVGQKQAGISVEVVKGQRKTISYAFIQRMPNGESLVMARVKGQKKDKGKIEALYSLSVWQLFRKTAAQIIPFATERLQQDVADEVLGDFDKALQA